MNDLSADAVGNFSGQCCLPSSVRSFNGDQHESYSTIFQVNIDVLFVAWNRLEFTRKSLDLLLKNTDWSQLRRLIIYDDTSTDGTREFLSEAVDVAGQYTDTEFHVCSYGSPVSVMNWYARCFDGDYFVKIDNDIAVPPNWVGPVISVLNAHPEVELLGLEYGQPAFKSSHESYSYTPATHIGGVGAMKCSAFTTRKPPDANGRFGFTEWQHEFEPIRGWLTPSLKVLQFDKITIEPWLTLSNEYVKKEWQRKWEKYPRDMTFSWLND